MQLQDQKNSNRYFQSQKRQIFISYHLRQQQSALPVHHKKISQTYCTTNFQNKYIFCGKEVKYVKTKSEFLRKRVVEQAKSNILQHAKEKNHFHLIVLVSTNDLIAAEAQYHPSCYADYTRYFTGIKVVGKSDYHQQLELEAFQEVIKYCNDIICSPSIFKFENYVVNYEK